MDSMGDKLFWGLPCRWISSVAWCHWWSHCRALFPVLIPLCAYNDLFSLIIPRCAFNDSFPLIISWCFPFTIHWSSNQKMRTTIEWSWVLDGGYYLTSRQDYVIGAIIVEKGGWWCLFTANMNAYGGNGVVKSQKCFSWQAGEDSAPSSKDRDKTWDALWHCTQLRKQSLKIDEPFVYLASNVGL